MQNFNVEVTTLTVEQAKHELELFAFTSAIGHQTTAYFLSQLLDKKIDCNRIAVDCKIGDQIMSFSFQKRLEEGQILSHEEIRNFPMKILYYTFYLEE